MPEIKKLCSFKTIKTTEFLWMKRGRLSSFGSFDRIDFLGFHCCNSFHMCGDIAVSVLPFQGRIRSGCAVDACFKGSRSFATLAVLNDRCAGAAIVAATCSSHEYAVLAISYCSTKHNLKSYFISFKNTEKSNLRIIPVILNLSRKKAIIPKYGPAYPGIKNPE